MSTMLLHEYLHNFHYAGKEELIQYFVLNTHQLKKQMAHAIHLFAQETDSNLVNGKLADYI